MIDDEKKQAIADACFAAGIPTIEKCVADVLEVAALMAVDGKIDVLTFTRNAARYWAQASGQALKECEVQIVLQDKVKVS